MGCLPEEHADFQIASVKSRLNPKVYRNMFRVKPRATLGLILFTVLIQKSKKQWKVRSDCLQNFPWEFPRVISLSLWAAALRKVC